DLVVTAPDGTLYRGNRFDPASGESLPSRESPSGGTGDASNDVERVLLSRPPSGNWHATVRPVRGNFAEGQGYALVVSGAVRAQGGSSERVVVPTTVTLQLTQASSSKDGPLNSGDIARLLASDNNRYNLRSQTQLALTFEKIVPPTA